MLQGQQEPLRNQTALVDKSRSTVTYYVTSQHNQSAVVLYDSRNVSVPGQQATSAAWEPREEPGLLGRELLGWEQEMQT